MSRRIDYHLSRPDPETLRMIASEGNVTVICADLHLPGKTPSKIANALHQCACSHLILSRPARVTADWPNEINQDAKLWQRFRDVVAQIPRGQG